MASVKPEENPRGIELHARLSMKPQDDLNDTESIKKAAGLTLATCALLWGLYMYIVGELYMDERYHVPQGLSIHEWIRKGFKGSYEVDPDITTFPGIYFLAFLTGGFAVGPEYSLTALGVFRLCNAIFVPAFQFFCVYKMQRTVSGTLLAVLFPINFFYNFMFYTDPAATAFVLASLWLLRDRKFFLSGIAAIAAVVIRQTNIVWIFGLSLDHVFTLWKLRRSVPKFILGVVKDLWLHAAVGVWFAAFLVNNNFSIVIGHHEHHAMHLHLSQMNYLIFTLVVTLDPRVLFRFTEPRSRREKLVFASVLLSAVLASEFGYMRHIFLNDTRHLSHAFHRWFANYRIVRSGLIPLIVAQGLSKSDLFKGRIEGLRASLFWLCTFMVLIPTPLMEFRYFTVPGVLLLLGVPWTETRKWNMIKLFIYGNAFSFILFLFFPIFGDEGDWRRLMY